LRVSGFARALVFFARSPRFVERGLGGFAYRGLGDDIVQVHGEGLCAGGAGLPPPADAEVGVGLLRGSLPGVLVRDRPLTRPVHFIWKTNNFVINPYSQYS
jgi:hypothetical protein